MAAAPKGYVKTLIPLKAGLVVLAFVNAVSTHQIRAKTQVDCFAWQYAFHAHLVYGRAPLTQAQLVDLTQAVHVFRGHLDPIAAADEILLTWPFDVTEWGSLP